MSALAYIIIGGVLMVAGAVLLYAWLTGKSKWFDSANVDPQNSPSIDALSIFTMVLYFLAMVIAPLLGGALMIVYGLRQY
jgi:hypothetical protein